VVLPNIDARSIPRASHPLRSREVAPGADVVPKEEGMKTLREALVALRDNWKADPLCPGWYVKELSALIAAYPVKPTNPVVRRKA